jgi:multisubunit Na+/H+ antiporter MnhG subunit
MTKVLCEVMLWAAVGLELIYCLGIAQFRRAMDALHIYSAATMLAPLLLIVAIALSEGASKATLKAVTIALVFVVQSPLIAHIVGRALQQREVDRGK